MFRLVLILFLLSQITYGQKTTKVKIDSVLKQFHTKKVIALHIHSNKSTYINQERIWFAIYAFDKENAKINLDNYNVVVQLTDANNIVISKGLFYLNNGQVNGNFTLNPEIKTDTYYLRAFISNNSKHTTVFTKAIKIMNPYDYSKHYKVGINNQNLDIQILPEGGYLISDVVNSCGIKILNSYGKGIQVKNLILEDDKGNILKSDVVTNRLGMGKFSFKPKEKTTYFLRSIHKKFKQKLPKIYKTGIALKIKQNFTTGELQIELNTNEESLATYSKEDITIAIHKEGLVYNYTTKFEEDYSKLVFNIPSQKLFAGTNTITVFNKDFQPLVERLFFNFESLKDNDSYIREVSKINDTLTYTIMNRVNNNTVKTQTSISVLPLKTIANANRDHLFASIYLKPFLTGSIENPSYYFQNNSNQKRFELDLLLLNQGWSKYKWNTIFNASKTQELKSNSGLIISGYVVPVNKKKSLRNILLYSKENEDIKMVNLTNDTTFNIENLVLQTGSEFEFSAFDSSGKPVNANFFFTVKPSAKELDTKFEIDILNPLTNTNLNEKIIENFEGEVLAEVDITANKFKFEKFTRGRYGVKVDSSIYVYKTVEDYFRINENLRLVYHVGGGSDTPGYYWTYPDGEKAYFILNGNRATYMNGLLGISLENILELYHGGRDGYGRRISHLIYTNGKELELPEHLKTSKVFKLNNGFTFQKETYVPRYINYESDSYQKFAAVAWEPLLISDQNGYNRISFINPGKHDLLFYIEGYTETGDPFSTITSYKNKNTE